MHREAIGRRSTTCQELVIPLLISRGKLLVDDLEIRMLYVNFSESMGRKRAFLASFEKPEICSDIRFPSVPSYSNGLFDFHVS